MCHGTNNICLPSVDYNLLIAYFSLKERPAVTHIRYIIRHYILYRVKTLRCLAALAATLRYPHRAYLHYYTTERRVGGFRAWHHRIYVTVGYNHTSLCRPRTDTLPLPSRIRF